MGLTREYVKFITDSVGGPVFKKKILEIGNQKTRPDLNSPCKTGKEYWQSLGAQHTSIDLNGRDGAFVMDLEKNIVDNFQEKFDLVLDIGTSCYMLNVWQCFKNLYELCALGGLIIHILPERKSKWTGKTFFEMSEIEHAAWYLDAVVVNREIISSNQHGNLVAVASMKTSKV